MRSDNRIENLRLATYSQNAANRKIHLNTETGHRNILLNRKKDKVEFPYIVQCTKDHVVHSAKCPSLKEAKEAAIFMRKELYGEFAIDNRPCNTGVL